MEKVKLGLRIDAARHVPPSENGVQLTPQQIDEWKVEMRRLEKILDPITDFPQERISDHDGAQIAGVCTWRQSCR